MSFQNWEHGFNFSPTTACMRFILFFDMEQRLKSLQNRSFYIKKGYKNELND